MSTAKSSFFKNRSSKKTFLMAFLWAGLFVLAIILRSVLLPFLLAGLLAFVLNPIVTKISKIKFGCNTIPRWVAIIVVYLAIMAITVLVATFFVPEIYREATKLTKDATAAINQIDEATIQNYSLKIGNFFKKYNLPVEVVAPGPVESSRVAETKDNLISVDLIQVSKNLLAKFMGYVRSESSDIILQVQNILTSIIGFLLKFILVFMITGFLLADTNHVYESLLNLSPKENRPAFKALLDRVDSGLSGVVRGQLVICLVNAILTLIGLLLLKVKFAFLLATLAGIFSLVPVFGSIISTIPIFFVGLSGSIYTGVFALAWIIAIHALEANLLNPKIMGNSAKIHPVLIILALVAGKQYYGIVGALLAVPITSIMLTLFRSTLIKAKELESLT